MKFNVNGQQQAYIIAEMSANHSGSINTAKEIIHAAKESGADCVKIQTYTADTMTLNCDKPYFHIEDGLWRGETLYQLYQRAYTPWEWQRELKAETEKAGLDFLSTPFDQTSVDFLEDIGVEFYKVASFELVDIPLIDYIASKGKPMIISTGMGSCEEIQEAVDTVKRRGNSNIALLRCASAYPAVSSEMNLLTMQDMNRKFQVPVGLSDHSMGSVAAITAVALGAKIIEKHFCLSRTQESPDSAFSMEPEEFCRMVQDIRMAEKAIGEINYGPTSQEKENLNYRRSIFSARDVKKGETFTEENIRIVRPGYGLSPKYWKEILGKKAAMDISFGTPLTDQMIDKE